DFSGLIRIRATLGWQEHISNFYRTGGDVSCKARAAIAPHFTSVGSRFACQSPLPPPNHLALRRYIWIRTSWICSRGLDDVGGDPKTLLAPYQPLD
ncbi:hypothetical protein J6590_034097, partial [Homalodisca vitripennis]